MRIYLLTSWTAFAPSHIIEATGPGDLRRAVAAILPARNWIVAVECARGPVIVPLIWGARDYTRSGLEFTAAESDRVWGAAVRQRAADDHLDVWLDQSCRDFMRRALYPKPALIADARSQ